MSEQHFKAIKCFPELITVRRRRDSIHSKVFKPSIFIEDATLEDATLHSSPMSSYTFRWESVELNTHSIAFY